MWPFCRPRPNVQRQDLLSQLGTPYGGWHFVHSSNFHEGSVLAAGLGEDASFEVAFASIYGAHVVVVDPTPRAIEHFAEIQYRLGRVADSPFKAGGSQPVSAYDLSRVGTGNLTLEEAALWSTNGFVDFFPPSNPDHVSHSISNYQNGRKAQAGKITVRSIDYQTLCDKYFGGKSPELIKLDIEGAEIQVLPQILKNPPGQILVEFDELALRDRRSIKDWRHAHRALLSAGFVCVHHERFDFSYLRSG